MWSIVVAWLSRSARRRSGYMRLRAAEPGTPGTPQPGASDAPATGAERNMGTITGMWPGMIAVPRSASAARAAASSAPSFFNLRAVRFVVASLGLQPQDGQGAEAVVRGDDGGRGDA